MMANNELSYDFISAFVFIPFAELVQKTGKLRKRSLINHILLNGGISFMFDDIFIAPVEGKNMIHMEKKSEGREICNI